MNNSKDLEQVFFSPSDIALKAGISRQTVYDLNQKHGFIRKLGRRSLIRWTDFEQALMQETENDKGGN